MSISNALASMAVKDLNAAETWYEAVLGRKSDRKPMNGLVEWTFADGGILQVYEGKERAGGCSCTLVVSSGTDDLDSQISKLQKLGAHVPDVQSSTTSDGIKMRTVMVKDPDGNSLAFAESSK